MAISAVVRVKNAKRPFPKDIHSLLMRSIAQDNLAPTAPRASARLLWRHTSAELEAPHQQDEPELLVQVNGGITISDPNLEICSITETQIPDGGEHTIKGLVSRLYQPMQKLSESELEVLHKMGLTSIPTTAGGATRKVPIPAEILEQRLKERLTNRGFEVGDLSAHIREDLRIDSSRNRRIPTCWFEAKVKADKDTLSDLILNGFGKGKNYGLGLITAH